MLFSLLGLASALATQPIGFPIHVQKIDNKCHFFIQDMIVTRRSDVRQWMQELDDKGRQIDLLWSKEADKGCLRVAASIVRRAGFTNVLIFIFKDDGTRDYPSGLPPINGEPAVWVPPQMRIGLERFAAEAWS